MLLLRYLEALSLEETAGRLGITVPAVAKRAERGLENLRKVMTPAGRGTPTAALATAMAHEASQHLPVGLPDKLTSVPTASLGSTITQIAVVQVLTGPVVQDGRVEYARQWSSTKGTALRPGGQEVVVELPDESGRLTVEIAGAQWTRLGLVDQQHPLVAGPVQVKVAAAAMLGSICSVTLSC